MWTAYLGLGFGICLVSVFLFYDYWNNQTAKFSIVQGEQKIDIKSDFETHFEASKPHRVKSLAHYQFQNRRNLISDYCQLNQNSSELHQVNQDLKWNKDLWFDYKNQLLFCQISKISSSTWVTNLMALKGKNIHEVNKELANQLHLQPPEFRPYMRQHFFPLKNNSFLDARDDLLSFVFVREPFERLVSSYYDKMDRDWSKPVYDLRWMRDEIIHKIRHLDPKLHKAEKPTPEEFIKYIIKTAKSIGPYALDNHIKPIWASCPFCSVEFDIVGHLEEFNKDSAFIHVNMDLMDKLDVTLHKHTLSKGPKTKRLPGALDRVSQFFSGIPKEVILELYEYCKRDYDMFGYPPPKALVDVNTKDKLVISK